MLIAGALEAHGMALDPGKVHGPLQSGALMLPIAGMITGVPPLDEDVMVPVSAIGVLASNITRPLPLLPSGVWFPSPPLPPPLLPPWLPLGPPASLFHEFPDDEPHATANAANTTQVTAIIEGFAHCSEPRLVRFIIPPRGGDRRSYVGTPAATWRCQMRCEDSLATLVS
jgi:hypothetical protein